MQAQPHSAPPQPTQISAVHSAGVSVSLPDEAKKMEPALTATGFFTSSTEQFDAITARHAMHVALDDNLKQAPTPTRAKQDPSINVKISQVAHQVLAELVHGNMAMRIDAGDMQHLLDTIRDHALLYVNSLSEGQEFCPATLKGQLMNHPHVQDFKEMNDPHHGHHSTMKHHPKTGMPSKTAIASHVDHCGTVEEHQHGVYLGHTSD